MLSGAWAPEFLSEGGLQTAKDLWTHLLAQIHRSFPSTMAILVCPWSWRKSATFHRVHCPRDQHPLAHNGQFARTVWDRHGAHAVVIHRYRCARCQTTYSALPWDLQPHRSVSRPVLWAIWGWRVHRHWSWRRVAAWCQPRFPITPRTLQRWVQTVQGALATLGSRLLQALAQTGTTPAPVWTVVGPDAWATWWQLWRAWGRAAAPASASTGSWLQVSAVAGWLTAHTS